MRLGFEVKHSTFFCRSFRTCIGPNKFKYGLHDKQIILVIIQAIGPIYREYIQAILNRFIFFKYKAKGDWDFWISDLAKNRDGTDI